MASLITTAIVYVFYSQTYFRCALELRVSSIGCNYSMITIPDLSIGAVYDALQNKLQYIEDERVKERDYLMDWYEGINIDNYVADYFGKETLRQAVIPQNNLTRRVCSLRAMTYKRPPRIFAVHR